MPAQCKYGVEARAAVCGREKATVTLSRGGKQHARVGACVLSVHDGDATREEVECASSNWLARNVAQAIFVHCDALLVQLQQLDINLRASVDVGVSVRECRVRACARRWRGG